MFYAFSSAYPTDKIESHLEQDLVFEFHYGHEIIIVSSRSTSNSNLHILVKTDVVESITIE